MIYILYIYMVPLYSYIVHIIFIYFYIIYHTSINHIHNIMYAVPCMTCILHDRMHDICIHIIYIIYGHISCDMVGAFQRAHL